MNIRNAQKSDVSAILSLIKELALFENEPHAVKTTEADILRDGFGSAPLFQVILAEDCRGACGFALFYYCWSTWTGRPSMFLEDLYVKESHRGKGIGIQLLRKCAQIAVGKNCARFEWEVLDWNQGAREFYHKIGASNMEDWLIYRLDGQALANFAKP